MWKAFLFGVIVAGAIGPIALLIFGTGARQGLAAGASAGLGAALADLLYALAAFSAGAILLPFLTGHEQPIRIGCASLLVGLGSWLLVAQAKGSEAPAVPVPASRSFLPTFLLTVVNPMTFMVFAGVVPQLPVAGSLARAAGLAFALAAGSALVNVAIGGCGAVIGRALPGERGRRAVASAAAAGIVAFGIYGIASAIQGNAS